jgi:hypothetical protein
MLKVLPGTPRLTSQLEKTTGELAVGGMGGFLPSSSLPPQQTSFAPSLNFTWFWPDLGQKVPLSFIKWTMISQKS